MIWETRFLKPRLKRVETWFQSEMNWENDLWLKCRFHEFDDFECGSAVLLRAGLAVYVYTYWLVLDWTVSRNSCVCYEYWLVMDLTVSRNGCVWYEYWLVLDWTVSQMADMDVDPWMRIHACLCWIIDNCDLHFHYLRYEFPWVVAVASHHVLQVETWYSVDPMS